jgi:hypothetical protein
MCRPLSPIPLISRVGMEVPVRIEIDLGELGENK